MFYVKIQLHMHKLPLEYGGGEVRLFGMMASVLFFLNLTRLTKD